jgi:hypothetical protein
MQAVKASALQYFSKFQLGVGLSMGPEAVVHSIKKKMSENRWPIPTIRK